MKALNLMLMTVISVSLLSQDIKTAEVKVFEGFVPKIPESEKIKETTFFIDTTKIDKTQEYKFINKKMNISFNSRPLKPAKISGEKLFDNKKSSIIFGFGSNSITSNVSYSDLSKHSFSYGLRFNQKNSKYRVNYEDLTKDYDIFKNSLVYLNVFGQMFGKDNIFTGNVEYERKTSNYMDDFSRNSECNDCNLNVFSYSKFGFGVISKELSDAKLKHKTNFFVSNLNEFLENQLHLSTILRKHVSGYPIKVRLEFNDYINYNNNIFVSNITKTELTEFSISPSAMLKKYGLDFNFGAYIYYQTDDLKNNSFNFLPQLDISKHLVRDIVFINGGVRSKRIRNTIKSLSDENPLISGLGINKYDIQNNYNSFDLQTTDIKNELYLGMVNVLGNDELFDGNISYGRISNMPLFNWVDLGSNGRFVSSYVDVWRTQINLNYSWQINELVAVNATTNYFIYDTLLSNKENFNLNSGFSLNLDNKIKVNTSLSYLGERKSFQFYEENDIFQENLGEYYLLNPQIHLNIKFDYNYSNYFSGYLKINNIFNSKQEMWQGYREMGINAWAGISYSF